VGDLVRVQASCRFSLLYVDVARAFGPVNVESTTEAQILQ
jgi:hypothetical protein